MPKANVPEKRASSNRNKNKGTAAAAAPVHKVEWTKNPDWTWSLIAYLTGPSYLQDQTVLGLDC